MSDRRGSILCLPYPGPSVNFPMGIFKASRSSLPERSAPLGDPGPKGLVRRLAKPGRTMVVAIVDPASCRLLRASQRERRSPKRQPYAKPAHAATMKGWYPRRFAPPNGGRRRCVTAVGVFDDRI